mmetsp:Transcript_28995/g.84650  ORF Transcript_28995/g.84650 Transcript_28995/m.84650 type:complete len:210 (-) Transcript_28995:12-641(-)
MSKGTGDKKRRDAASSEDADGSSGATRDADEVKEIIQVETGDFVKVKQTLDESVVKAILDMGYQENHYWDNVKLALMVVACIFAMIAQFYPMPFPDSRPLLGVCCASYFVASSILQLIVSYIEQDCIMITQPRPPTTSAAHGLRIRTNFPRFQYEYQIIVEENTKGDGINVTWTHMVNDFFSEDGYFDDEKFESEVQKVVGHFESKKRD